MLPVTAGSDVAFEVCIGGGVAWLREAEAAGGWWGGTCGSCCHGQRRAAAELLRRSALSHMSAPTRREAPARGDVAPMAEYARRERLCAERRRAGGKGGRAGGRATEEFDVAQLRAGGDDRAHDVGGGHATRESRRGPLRARRAKAAMSGAAISHLWAATGVTVKLATGWILCLSYHWWAGSAAAALKKRGKKRLLL